jgi:hypothetical protein
MPLPTRTRASTTIVGLGAAEILPYSRPQQEGRLEPKSKMIARVAVERAIRITPGPRRAASPNAAPLHAPIEKDLVCSSCGTTICDGPRVRLFCGIVLRCTSCGAANRAP